MSIHIRYAEPMDAPVLGGFQLRMANETEDTQLVEETVAEGVSQLIRDRHKGFYLVAENGSQELVGCLIITYEWSDWRNGWIWWIGSLFVEKAYRNQGVFRLLLNRVLELGRESGVKALRLYMDKDNEQARRAYLKSGFTASHYEVLEYEGPGLSTPEDESGAFNPKG
jgi:GNAT superfamily N-acetyltransferase